MNWPTGKYSIIYADPPWQYRVYDKDSDAAHGAATAHYETMAPQDIKNLPVKDIADPKRCALFLWITMPNLPVGLDVMSSWGFEFVTTAFTWVKLRNGKPFFGLGHWTRGNPEICLLGRIGKIRRVDKTVEQLIMSPLREHSRKPDEARDRIVQLMGDLPRIELFARQRVDRWDAWGDEA